MVGRFSAKASAPLLPISLLLRPRFSKSTLSLRDAAICCAPLSRTAFELILKTMCQYGGAPAPPYWHKVQRMSSNDVRDKGAQQIAASRKDNVNLANIGLSNNEIGNSGAEALAENLPTTKKIPCTRTASCFLLALCPSQMETERAVLFWTPTNTCTKSLNSGELRGSCY